MHINEATATNQQAEHYYQEGKWTEAAALCHQLIQIQPNFAPIYKTLGNILQAQGKLEAATGDNFLSNWSVRCSGILLSKSFNHSAQLGRSLLEFRKSF